MGLAACCLQPAMCHRLSLLYTYRPVRYMYIYTYTTPDWLVGPSYLGALFDRTGRTCLCSALTGRIEPIPHLKFIPLIPAMLVGGRG